MLYDWCITGLWIILLLYWFVSAMSAKKNTSSYWRSFTIVRILFSVIFVILLESHVFTLSQLSYSIVSANPVIAWLGVVLCAAGVAFAIWARVYLGRNWGMPMSVKQDGELVTSGPYEYVRHPIYTGVLLAMVGTALTTGLLWLVPFVFFGAYFIYSATQEEKRMTREFPNEYPAYKQRTKMLIPFVF